MGDKIEIIYNGFFRIGYEGVSLFVVTKESLFFDAIVAVDSVIIVKFSGGFGGNGRDGVDCFRDEVVFGKGAV